MIVVAAAQSLRRLSPTDPAAELFPQGHGLLVMRDDFACDERSPLVGWQVGDEQLVTDLRGEVIVERSQQFLHAEDVAIRTVGRRSIQQQLAGITQSFGGDADPVQLLEIRLWRLQRVLELLLKFTDRYGRKLAERSEGAVVPPANFFQQRLSRVVAESAADGVAKFLVELLALGQKLGFEGSLEIGWQIALAKLRNEDVEIPQGACRAADVLKPALDRAPSPSDQRVKHVEHGDGATARNAQSVNLPNVIDAFCTGRAVAWECVKYAR